MIDILLDETGDLQLDDNGGLIIGESTGQHQQLLLAFNKGDLKESPLVGVGAEGFLKDEDDSGLLAETKQQFEKDGMKVVQLAIDENKNLFIDAYYKETSNTD